MLFVVIVTEDVSDFVHPYKRGVLLRWVLRACGRFRTAPKSLQTVGTGPVEGEPDLGGHRQGGGSPPPDSVYTWAPQDRGR